MTAGDLDWRPRRRWVVWVLSASLAWAAAWLGGYAALGALDRVFGVGYIVLWPFLYPAGAAWGQRLRVTADGVEYVNALSRWSVDWSELEAVDQRHLTYRVARETTNDTGLKISMDRFVRAAPRKHRRIPLRPFGDDQCYATLLERLSAHRPDLQ